jgi:hypothetical protein
MKSLKQLFLVERKIIIPNPFEIQRFSRPDITFSSPTKMPCYDPYTPKRRLGCFNSKIRVR